MSVLMNDTLQKITLKSDLFKLPT